MADTAVTARIGSRIDALGGTWMGRPLMEAGAELGFAGYPWPLYMVGRGGVLGDVDPDEVAAAMVFPSPALVRSAWSEGRATLTPEEGVSRFIRCADSWAPGAIGSAPDLPRTAALLERLAHDVDCSVSPLAEGWRRVAPPDDVPARAVRAINVLREQRGGVHAAAVLSGGLSPLEAVMATEGEQMAAMYGWERPYPDPEECRARKVSVEAATNEQVARDYAVMPDDELHELALGLERLEP